MRVESKWTPRGIALWLIAAILATLAVCTQLQRDEPASEPSRPVDFEVVK